MHMRIPRTSPGEHPGAASGVCRATKPLSCKHSEVAAVLQQENYAQANAHDDQYTYTYLYIQYIYICIYIYVLHVLFMVCSHRTYAQAVPRPSIDPKLPEFSCPNASKFVISQLAPGLALYMYGNTADLLFLGCLRAHFLVELLCGIIILFTGLIRSLHEVVQTVCLSFNAYMYNNRQSVQPFTQKHLDLEYC